MEIFVAAKTSFNMEIADISMTWQMQEKYDFWYSPIYLWDFNTQE